MEWRREGDTCRVKRVDNLLKCKGFRLCFILDDERVFRRCTGGRYGGSYAPTPLE